MNKPFDPAAIRHVERIVVGSSAPERPRTEEENLAAVAQVNFLLNRASPKGVVMKTESGETVYQMGERQIVREYVAYHIGFERRPNKLKDTDA